MATIQQLIQEYGEKAQQVRSPVTFPYIDNIGENSLNAGRELAYKGIISILEHHLRGDFPLSKCPWTK